jgi:hypothetical protein
MIHVCHLPSLLVQAQEAPAQEACGWGSPSCSLASMPAGCCPPDQASHGPGLAAHDTTHLLKLNACMTAGRQTTVAAGLPLPSSFSFPS